MKLQLFLLRTLALSILILVTAPAYAQQNGAAPVVERFQESLLAVMKGAKKSSVQERYDQLLPRIEEAFFLPLMVKYACGSYWESATRAQRDKLVIAFKRMNISTVATLFNGYSGQLFKTIRERPAPQNTRIVETKIIDPDKSFVDLAYRMARIRNHWRIIDVIVDNGITELTVRRSEYNNILKNKGIQGLIDSLNAKADELMSQ